MKILGSIFYALVLAACCVPATAQSASKAPTRDYLAPHDSRDQTPPVSVVTKLKLAKQAGAEQQLLGQLAREKAKIVAGNSTVCYAIRSYNYGPVNSLTEVPTPTGSSTCTHASDSHLKGAVVFLR